MMIRAKVACCLVVIGTIIGLNTYLVQTGQERLRGTLQRLKISSEQEMAGAQRAFDAAYELDGALRELVGSPDQSDVATATEVRVSVEIVGLMMDRIDQGLRMAEGGTAAITRSLKAEVGAPAAGGPERTAVAKARASLADLREPWRRYAQLAAARPGEAAGLLREQVLPILQKELLPACSQQISQIREAAHSESATMDLLLRDFGRRLIVAGVVSIFAVVAAGFFLLWHVAGPLEKLVATANAVAAGDLSARALVGYRTQDEFDALANALNHMLDRLQTGTVRRDELERLVGERSQELVLSEDRFRRLFKLSPVAMTLSDLATGKFIDVNEKFCELNDRRREDLIGRTSTELGLWQGASLAREKLHAELIEKGSFNSSETAFRRPDGSIFHVAISAEIFESGDKQIIVAGFLDITQRKVAEERMLESNADLERLVTERTAKLMRSESQMGLIWEGALDGMRLTDAAGTVVRANESYCRLMGLSREELEGQPMSAPYAEFRRAEILEKHCRRFRERSIPALVETAVTLADGSVRDLEVANAFVTLADEGGLVFSVFRDITQRKRAEAALRATEERFQLVNRATFDVIWDQNLHTKAIWWSDQLEVIYGYRPDEAGKNGDFWRSCIHPDDYARVTAGVRRALLSNDETWFESYRFRRKDGAYAYVEDRSLIVRDADGRAVRLLGAMQDITERKAAEAELRQSNERFHAVFERSPLIIGLLSIPEGRMIEVNLAGLAAFGGTREEVIGRTSVELDFWVNPADRDYYLNELRTKGHVSGFETQIRRKNGEILTVLYNGSLIEIAGKKYSLNSLQDITARRQAEAAQRESEERFRLVFDASPIPILLSEPKEGRLVEVNSVALECFGFTREEVIGKTTLELSLWVRPEQREEFFRRIATDRAVHGFEAVMRTKTGRECIMLCNGCLLMIGGSPCVLTSAIDITLVRRAENEKAQLQERLFQNQKYEALGTLAGGVAHDFNNILTGIINYTALARSDCPSSHPQVKEFLGEVLKGGSRAKELVRQILLFSRSEDAERVPQPLQPVIKEALSLLRATLPAAIEIESLVDPLAPVILANATQIHQVVMNLGINAAHAMQERGGKLQVSLRPQIVDDALASEIPNFKPGSYVCLEIADNGTGMVPAVVARIFEPFFTTKCVGEGTGLGLAVAHSVVRSHHGAITVQSELGVGTTFKLYFPVLVVVPRETEVESREFQRGKGQHILLVDDEAMVAKSVQLMLERLGYRVTAHTNPENALAAFAAAPDEFQLVLADFQLPGMTGVVLAQKIMALRPALPIFIASGFSGSMSERKILDEGVAGFLQKPIDLLDLARLLAKTLS